MDDMYNGSGMNGAGEQPYQQSVQEQLQYQYDGPRQELEEPVSMGEWLITFLIMLIPCANIIMMFVWAFSKNEKKSKSNYFKAALIYVGIIVALYIILLVVLGATMFAGLGRMY